MKTVGRLLVRKGHMAGLYIPFEAESESPLKSGIYEIRETLGELMLVRIGVPALSDAHCSALNLHELMQQRDSALMTAAELRAVKPK